MTGQMRAVVVDAPAQKKAAQEDRQGEAEERSAGEQSAAASAGNGERQPRRVSV